MTTRWTLMVVMAFAAGCGTATNNAGTLTTTGEDAGGSGNGGNPCNDTCAAQAAVGCSAFQMGTCVSTCQAQYTAYPSCTAELDAAVRCSAGATYTCSSTTNRPTTSMCLAELASLLRCGAPDGGP